jgi:N-acetylmuramoyl-L-alanine amidase
MNPQQQAEQSLLALVIWREARGEVLFTKQAVAWSIRNRVLNPGWWGHSWWSVILMPMQYSSFNRTDPNATKWPMQVDPSWEDALQVAADVYTAELTQAPKILDLTSGSVSYFDQSMDNNPPSWAIDGHMKHVCDFGRLHFYAKV